MGLLHRKKAKGDLIHANSDKHGKAQAQVVPTYDQDICDSDPLAIQIAQVLSSLHTYGLEYESKRARKLLSGRFGYHDPHKALVLALALRDAQDMVVVPPSSQRLLGSENLLGTTCYLDALLFSMFSRTFPIFEALLYHPGTNENADKLIVNLRLFVNLLRSGYLITSDLVDMLRNSIAGCGWTDAGTSSQQDSSECFGFIAEMLQMPTLTFKVRIAHGGQEDIGADHKMIEERFLALSIPQPSHFGGPAVELVDLIDAYFHAKLMVRRPMARSRSTLMKTSFATPVNSSQRGVQSSTGPRNPHAREVSMQAWQLFELVPHYTATDQSPKQQDFATQPPVVAICLKRYYFDSRGTAMINKTPVIIPEFIDFTPFTDIEDPATQAGRRIRLRLESAVCHRGEHVGSGHYVSIARGEQPNQWLLFDDLATHRVTQGSYAQLFSTETPYLLFYQLETLHPKRYNRRQPSVPHFEERLRHQSESPYPTNTTHNYSGADGRPPYPI